MTKRKLIIGAVLFLLLTVGIVRWKTSQIKVTATPTANTDAPLKSTTLNKDFSFPGISYTLQSAELRNTIILRGERATAITGKMFLIINLKLKNDSNTRLQLNTQDYVRLSVNGSEEWLAPDIHNDPLEIQPISTKLTRLGFAVNTGDTNFRLQAGEIKGEKTIIPVNF